MKQAGIMVVKDQQGWEAWLAAIPRGTLFSERQTAAAELAQAIDQAIQSRCSGREVGVLFSGGIDSGLIAHVAKKYARKVVLFCIGAEGGRDVSASEIAAGLLGLPLVSHVLADAEVKDLAAEVIKLTGRHDVVSVGVGITGLAAMRLAKRNGARGVFSGVGSEEIFAGYERHVLAQDVNVECWRGLAGMRERDFLRDEPLAESEGIEILAPFMDPAVIECAMRIPGEWKVENGQKKVILRETALLLGLPSEIAARPKLAAQYGSGVDKALIRLAKKGGSGKRDFLRELSGTSSR